MMKSFLLSTILAAGASAVTEAEGVTFANNFFATASSGFAKGDMADFYKLVADDCSFDWSGGQKGEGKEALVKTMKASWEAMNSAFLVSDVSTVVDEDSGLVSSVFEVTLNLNAHGKLPNCIVQASNLFEFKLNAKTQLTFFRGVWEPRTFDSCFAAAGVPAPVNPPSIISSAEGDAFGKLLLSSFAQNIEGRNRKTFFSFISDNVNWSMTPGSSGSDITSYKAELAGWEALVSTFIPSNIKIVTDSETGTIIMRFELTINVNKQGAVPNCFLQAPNVWEVKVDANHVITDFKGKWNQKSPALNACVAKAMAKKEEL